MQDLTYGTAAIEAINYSKETSFLDAIFTECTQTKLPDSGNALIKKEMGELREYTQELQKNTVLLGRYKTYDHSLMNYILTQHSFNGDETADNQFKSTVKSLFEDIRPLVYKLKLHYNRPRPFQLVEKTNVKFHPFGSLSAHCPSFPSMHATIGYVLRGVIGNKFTDTYKYFTDLAEDIYYSRIYMGVCLRSDVEGGKNLAENILANKEFVVKYAL